MQTSAPGTGRLIRHDSLLASNLIQAAFSTWRDRLTLAIAIPLVLGIVYDRLAGLPAATAIHLCAFAAFALGFGAARGVARRLDFFRTESILAMDALSGAPAGRYALAGTGALALPLVLLIALLHGPAVPISIAALLAGGTLGGLLNVAGLFALLPRQKMRLFAIRRWLARPAAGLAMALVLGLLAGAAARLTQSDGIALTGIAAFIVALPLAGVDAAAARFMALSGFPAWRSIWRDMAPLLVFTGIASPIAGLAAGPAAGGVTAAIGATLLVTTAMRVLAYRIYGRRFADLVVSVLLGLLLVTAFSVPLVLPLVILATLWWLSRRARPALWLIA